MKSTIHTHKTCRVPRFANSVFIVSLLVAKIAAISLEAWSRAFPRGGSKVPTVVNIGFIWGKNDTVNAWNITGTLHRNESQTNYYKKDYGKDMTWLWSI